MERPGKADGVHVVCGVGIVSRCVAAVLYKNMGSLRQQCALGTLHKARGTSRPFSVGRVGRWGCQKVWIDQRAHFL